MEAKMALIEILKKYSFVQAPETEVSGLSLSTQTISYPPGLALLLVFIVHSLC